MGAKRHSGRRGRAGKAASKALPRGTGRGERTIAASEFKAKCLSIMDDVHERGDRIIITKYGEPVARLVPLENEMADSFGSLSGTVGYTGDVVAPDRDAWDESAE